MIENDWKQQIQDRMDFLGISRSELARLMDTSPQFVTNYLNNSRGSVPGPHVMERFAKALGLRMVVHLEPMDEHAHN